MILLPDGAKTSQLTMPQCTASSIEYKWLRVNLGELMIACRELLDETGSCEL